MMYILEFQLPETFSGIGGQPTKLSKGSLTSYGKLTATGGWQIIDSHSKYHKQLGKIVRDIFSEKYPEKKPIRSEVKVVISLSCKRPRKHFTSKGVLRANAPTFQSSYPDIDKMARAVLDTLSGLAFVDDKQVSRLEVQKTYTNRGANFLRIEIERIEYA